MSRALKILLGFTVSITLLCAYAAYEYWTLPDVQILKGCYTAKMNNVEVCPKKGSYARLSSISQNLIDAIIASEDASFWNHTGVDWHELNESFKTNWATKEFKRGGSTITQQLVKNVFFSKEKTISRKIKEAILAHRIEEAFSKKEILEKYLNTIEFGANLYGVRNAAQFYFKKSQADLNPLESAFLAFLLPNPKGYSQSYHKGRLTPFARKMVLLICKRLFFYNKISADEYNFARGHVDAFPWHGLQFGEEFIVEGESIDDLTEEALEEEFQQLLDNVSPGEEDSFDDSAL